MVMRRWQRELAMGICPRHGRPMNEVCGEYVCGFCYEEQLLREPMPKGGYTEGPELVRVYSPEKHMWVYTTKTS